MDIEPVASAGLITRQVRTSERNGNATRVIVASRTYDIDQADLWDALTNPDRLPRWFAPVTGTLEAGGQYQVEGNASGVIESCDEPNSFALTWVYGGSTSWVRLTLRPADEATELELAHEAPAFPPFWKEFGPGATGLGWELSLLFLMDYVATGAEAEPDAENEFCASETGQAFLGAAAAAWAEAAIVDGDYADEARQAADRSAAFYTPAAE